MFCPSCGAETKGTKFCENCGCSLPSELDQTIPAEQVTEPVAAQTTPIDQSTEPVAAAAEVPGDNAWQAQPQQAYQTEPTMQMPPQQAADAAGVGAGAPVPPQQTVGGSVPPSGAPQSPYQQAATHQATAGNQAPNAAFILVIVGLVLSVLFVTFLPGLICSIIGLVLNSGYQKKGFVNTRKTATNVIGIIGIVVGVLCLVTSIMLGVLTATVVDELDRQGIDITNGSFEASIDSSGNVNVVTGSSSSASSSSSSASSASSSASGSGLSAYVDDKYHDGDWNPTLYSVLELSGAEMTDLLESYNFEWDSDYEGWYASDGSMYAVSASSGDYSKSKIESMPKGGAGQPVVMALWVEGYATPSAAFNGLSTKVVTEKSSSADPEVYFAVVQNSSKVRYLVTVTESDTNEQLFLIFTEEAISTGYFEELTGVDAGSSIDQVWSRIQSGSELGTLS